MAKPVWFSKVRDVLIGFFGWLIIDNIYLILLLFVQGRVSASLEDSEVSVILWMPTLLALFLLIITEKFWISIGVTSAIFLNAGIWIVYVGQFFHERPDGGCYVHGHSFACRLAPPYDDAMRIWVKPNSTASSTGW